MTRLALFPLLALGLGACAPAPTPPVTSFTLTGRADGVSYPSGSVYLAGPESVHLADRGQFQAPDRFTLKVTQAPPAADAFDLTAAPKNCAFVGTASARPEVNLYDRLRVSTEAGDPLGIIEEAVTSGGQLPLSRVARVYSRGAATIKGDLKCTSGTNSLVSYDLNLKTGWNAVELSLVFGTTSMRTPTAPLKTEFRAQDALPYVQVQLAPSTLTFGANDTFTVAATFFQSGGISGTFRLLTDVPELSVEPQEITLAPLSAQGLGATPPVLRALGLRPQALQQTLTFRYGGRGVVTTPFTLDLLGDFDYAGRVDGMLKVDRP